MEQSEGFEIFTNWQNTIITNEEHYLNRFIESPLAHPTVMFRKELIEKFGFYSTRNIPEDYELWLRWMHKGVNFYKIPEKLVSWVDHKERLSRTNSNYSGERFNEIKIDYLSKWIRETKKDDVKIIVCGTGKNARERCELLKEKNISIFALTDVKKRNTGNKLFLHPNEILPEENLLVINLISKRGTGSMIRNYFLSRNFTEGENFILAG